jgi:hypothetical protein
MIIEFVLVVPEFDSVTRGVVKGPKGEIAEIEIVRYYHSW